MWKAIAMEMTMAGMKTSLSVLGRERYYFPYCRDGRYVTVPVKVPDDEEFSQLNKVATMFLTLIHNHGIWHLLSECEEIKETLRGILMTSLSSMYLVCTARD